ncbi:hypothetical protein Pla123a_40890 [Posidoniimonas polymericola]|uniref:Prepilin-type N-terminal cleavage/methylation domain-containing protein n=2 Tax=Posidoniimonas polymericola TaxID=2528002 RepID=A0A5C5YBM4_9BACT|nr:hypothetical protein Pla123a_40890 [Posidoniimonas polymericola]
MYSHRRPAHARPQRGFTLVEMLVAMSITLLMMAAVIAVFANVSASVADRRAGIEMSTRLRQARALLQDDLANHTCPALPWTRPESNHGYIEIVEGPQSDFAPSIWLQDIDNNGIVDFVGGNSPTDSSNGLQIDLAVSQLPGTNLARLPGSAVNLDSQYVTDGGGLGDWDDVLSLTVRNDDKPFVGRVPTDVPTDGSGFDSWGAKEFESPLAEVVWFAVENPVEPSDARTFYFGEPGFRTVYRRTMLIAPQLDYGILVNGQNVGPGVLRVLNVDLDEVAQAIAAVTAFQEQYDISVRLEWDPLLDGGRWVIKANTLGDLTKRENRFDHQHIPYGSPGTAQGQRRFPYHYVGIGRGLSGTIQVRPAFDVSRKLERNEDFSAAAIDKMVEGRTRDDGSGTVRTYRLQNRGKWLSSRPFVYVDDSSALKPTTRAIVNEDGQVVMFTNGMVPLSGDRRGEDVVLSNMLAFDIKVYDPEAPLLAEQPLNDTSQSVAYPGEVIGPGDSGWGMILRERLNNPGSGVTYQPIAGRGAYVDLGYYGLHGAFAARNTALGALPPVTNPSVTNLLGSSTFAGYTQPKSELGWPTVTVNGYAFQPYRTYDTWSTSYENNGKDDDGDNVIDPASNGFDDDGVNGVDDPGERETAPPYDTALRGIQVTLRAYELDSRQIREVNVKQTFMPK